MECFSLQWIINQPKSTYRGREMGDYATVEDIAEMMLCLMAEGKADHVVKCNSEYALAKKGDKPEVDDENNTVDLGGYC